MQHPQPEHDGAQENFFVARPVFAVVISIILIIFGAVAMSGLPISLYPDVVPPEIQVNSSYQGANAIAVEQSVTTPLEQKINGVEGSIYMRSINNSDGSSSVRVSFEVGTDIDMANVLVQNRVSEAMAGLPEEVKRVGVSVKKSLSFPLLLVAFESPGKSYTSEFLSNYVNINITDSLSRIPGVGQVSLFGGSDYAMRLWIDPRRLASLNLTVKEVADAVAAQNSIAPGGKIGGAPAPLGTQFTYPVQLLGRFTQPQDFGSIVVRSNPDGSIIRLNDIGRAELGSQSYDSLARYNGKDAALLSVYQLPGSNALDVANKVRSTLNDLSTRFPDDLTHSISLDTTKAVTAGVDEIKHTLLEAVVLVIVVVFLFLQSWRATIIPLLTIPVALIATFVAFPLVGFSINTLSLLGLVLAIGIVVDDAIVVVEAVMHHIEHGLSPRAAANKAMKEVTGPLLASTFVLVAVFVPVVFIAGITGLFYVQFAITISISVLFSLVNALTLSPALSARLLRPANSNPGRVATATFGAVNKGLNAITNVYLAAAKFFMRNLVIALVLLVGVFASIITIATILPTGFVPEEDQGYLLASVQLPNASSIERTNVVTRNIEQMLSETAGVESVSTVAGFSLLTQTYSPNMGFFFIWLKPWSSRNSQAEQVSGILTSINTRLATQVPEGQAFAFGPPAVPGLGTGSGFSLMLQDRAGGTPMELSEQTQKFIAAAKNRPEIGRISTSYTSSVPQVFADVDRERALALGVALPDIFRTLSTFLGGAYLNDFNSFGRLYKVYMQAAPEFRDSVGDLSSFFVRSASGAMVPLSALVVTEMINGPATTNRFNLARAAELVGTPAQGYSSTAALDALEEVAKEVLPSTFSFEWNALSFQERRAPAALGVMALGLLFVFLILAAQYESWSMPLTVVLSAPFCILGAFLGLWGARVLMGEAYLQNIYAQIGMLTLIGLTAKNAILIVEFARIKVNEGMDVYAAASEAARLRLRPILMTAFAFILGVLPLVRATGSGAEGRKVMGLAVASGMIFATVVGLLFVPAFFVLLHKLSSRGVNPWRQSFSESNHSGSIKSSFFCSSTKHEKPPEEALLRSKSGGA